MSVNDGGPAFARPTSVNTDGCIEFAQVGLSMRDYFAAAALPGVIAARTALVNADLSNDLGQESIAEECYELADALIAERERSR